MNLSRLKWGDGSLYCKLLKTGNELRYDHDTEWDFLCVLILMTKIFLNNRIFISAWALLFCTLIFSSGSTQWKLMWKWEEWGWKQEKATQLSLVTTCSASRTRKRWTLKLRISSRWDEQQLIMWASQCLLNLKVFAKINKWLNECACFSVCLDSTWNYSFQILLAPLQKNSPHQKNSPYFSNSSIILNKLWKINCFVSTTPTTPD